MIEDDRQHLPSGTLAFGMGLFLASLSMLFGASMIGYLIIRVTHADELPFSSIRPSNLLWVSTMLILASSVTIHWAVISVAHEKQNHFRAGMALTLLLAIGFIAVQTPALADLLTQHQQEQSRDLFVYGLVFFLIFIHAMHVLGGLIPLFVINFKSLTHQYDHENYTPVRCLGYYWHFLGAVWVLMFCLFMVLG